MKILMLLLLVLAGAAITTQSAVNSQLRGALHQVGWAVFISYVGGSLVAGGLLLATRAAVPSLADFGGLKWYYWTGGLLGVGYVLVIAFSLQRVGAASLFALVVAGQLLTALLYDQLGFFNLHRSNLSPARVGGALLLILGAYLLNRK